MAVGDLPADVSEALAGDETARRRFEALPPSHQNEYLKWVAEARKQETRARRITSMIERLAGEGARH